MPAFTETGRGCGGCTFQKPDHGSLQGNNIVQQCHPQKPQLAFTTVDMKLEVCPGNKGDSLFCGKCQDAKYILV